MHVDVCRLPTGKVAFKHMVDTTETSTAWGGRRIWIDREHLGRRMAERTISQGLIQAIVANGHVVSHNGAPQDLSPVSDLLTDDWRDNGEWLVARQLPEQGRNGEDLIIAVAIAVVGDAILIKTVLRHDATAFVTCADKVERWAERRPTDGPWWTRLGRLGDR